jgi:hypothetical protein
LLKQTEFIRVNYKSTPRFLELLILPFWAAVIERLRTRLRAVVEDFPRNRKPAIQPAIREAVDGGLAGVAARDDRLKSGKTSRASVRVDF